MNSSDSKIISTLIAKSRRLYNTGETPYQWEDIVEIIKADPEIFYACLRRATNPKYKLPLGVPKSYKLWISCNMAIGYKERKDCYFCGRIMTRDEFLAGNVHLEHFEPRDGGGAHIPVNITLACGTCNLLKRNLQDTDFDLILTNPKAFRAAHPSMGLKRFQQLVEFAEIIAPRYKGLGWVIERYGANSQNCRQVWEDLRFTYRKKWHNE